MKMNVRNNPDELEMSPAIGVSGGAALGSIWGATGILVGGIIGLVVAIGIAIYVFLHKAK